MRNPDYDPSIETSYECLDCGAVVETTTPSGCPDCRGTLRNKSFPLE